MHYYPEQFRINDLCESWVKRGYDVTVVTGIPNYPEGKFYKGYGWNKKRKDEVNGVKIRRLRIVSRGRGKIRLAVNYFSFLFAGFFFAKFTKIKTDYIFTFGVSPLIKAKIANWYKKNKKVKRIIYVQDLWPENLVSVGINNGFIIKCVYKTMQRIYKKTNYILTNSNSFIESISNMGVSKDKLEFWPQYAESFYSPYEKEIIPNDLILDETINFGFTGNIGEAQGLEILINSALILKEKGIKVRFNIIGDGRAKIRLVENIEKNNVEEYFNFTGRKEAIDIPVYLKQCKAVLLTFKESETLGRTIPAKFQSYLACGKPIIASTVGEVENIINLEHLGFCSKPGDAEKFAENIIKFMKLDDKEINEMCQRALKYSKMQYDKENLLKRFDEILERI